jgi:hypothetical protein
LRKSGNAFRTCRRHLDNAGIVYVFDFVFPLTEKGSETTMRSRPHRLLTITTAGALGALSVVSALTALPVGPASASPGSIRAVPLRLPPNAARGHNALSGLFSIDCVRPGFCTAGGGYATRRNPLAPMVAAQVDGQWQRATAIRLPSNSGGVRLSEVESVSCARVGDCTAVGSYSASHERTLNFTARESGGHWARALEIKPPRAADHRPAASSELRGVSCTGPGTCLAVGWYSTPGRGGLPMAVTEIDGHWTRAVELDLPANAALGSEQSALMTSVACSRTGFCTAVGGYEDRSAHVVDMAINESGGRWQRPTEIKSPPGATRQARSVVLTSVSCAGAGSCTAIGTYLDQAGNFPGLVVSETGGHWSRARKVTALPPGASKEAVVLNSISCVRIGDCVAVGAFSFMNQVPQIWLLAESAGHWTRVGRVVLPPGLNADPKAGAEGFGVSCTKSGYCALAGRYTTKSAILSAIAAQFQVH